MVNVTSKKSIDPITRLFLSPDCFESSTAVGDKEDAHYVKNVLRGKVGDDIIVLDGSGKEYFGVIENLDNKMIKISLTKNIEENREPEVDIILAQGMCKKDKWELILQKTTELGVRAIQPFYSENTVVHHKSEKELNKKLSRWEKILKNASEQSNRQMIPEVRTPLGFTEMLQKYSQINSVGKKIIFNEHESQNSLEQVYSSFSGGAIFLVVGPEGGFSKEEIDKAIDNDFISAGLGPRILRTETAAVIVTAITLFQLGEMGG
ncbi:16S rRNA (uracil(1498)-N(3))-methyltransferase [Natranaerofaba carboxydovora]|uniref:16S rRNA (uracil(1498)-N(3))-methyltransferase n=1 Tax=Natranaerofaba carboxydovora TaxID=2742683 RepID=UPI001F12B946|nr:16S rRNA (uracil(1498)-N(3))-methyltransferase [Natranaerofaba carboxydovora]UMZ73075.1 Ribosomal RNA small subunit methyltransferase E [Natranaerofaba carboxydovora]